MRLSRMRSAVSPLRRGFHAPAVLPTVDAIVAAERPEEPMHCLRPAAIEAASREFMAAFPGDTLYAVKCNPEPAVLRAVWRGGVRHFDCASAVEVALVRTLFADAHIHFMHPVKARGAIREAWQLHGVRDFVVDHADELAKVVAETGAVVDDAARGTATLAKRHGRTGARPSSTMAGRPAAATGEGRGIIVRLALPKGTAAYDLSGKFGATPEDAVALLRAARPLAARLGVSFHVGSQCLDPLAWRAAIALAASVIRAAGVVVDVLDVGGGFPAAYPDAEPPPLDAFMTAIADAVAEHGLGALALWAEPGRRLVAGGASVVVQVQLRRGDALYVSDGVYGALSDAGAPGFRFPSRLLRDSDSPTRPFMFFGPTCDSADRMAGPFVLPDDIAEGDWIEIGQLGAYGACLRTAFNGFDRARLVEVQDAPMLGAVALPLAA